MAAAMRSVAVCKLGEGMGRADKAQTALLLAASNETLQAGDRALKVCAAEADAGRKDPIMLFPTFKLPLAPPAAGPRDAMHSTVPAKGKVGGGAGDAGGTVELMLLVQRMLEAVKADAMRQMGPMLSATDMASARILWVLTVPAIWDDEGKAFMREAAVRAGLIPDTNSPRLLLALEPEVAVLAAYMDMAPGAREGVFKEGSKLMIVDCGGGTVDITVDEVASREPLTLREVAPASGGPWGATYVDKQFLGFMRELLGEVWPHVDNSIQLELLWAWEAAKLSVGTPGESDDVMVPLADLVSAMEEKRVPFSKADLATMMENYNTRHGLFADDALKLLRGTRLCIPGKLVRSFFMNIISKTVEHITAQLAAVRDFGGINAIVLVGGFAQSRVLQNELRAKFATPALPVLSPLRPGQAVTVGAALFALKPRVVEERIIRWTYAYLGAEAFNPAVHDERHAFMTAEGRKLVNILYPLVKKGDKVKAGTEVVKRGLIPVRSDQVVIDFDIFRTAAVVPNPRSDHDQMRAVPVDVLTEAGRNVGVLRSEKVATLSIVIGAEGRARTERTVDLHMSFAATEVVAEAVALLTGARQRVTIRYE